MLTSIQLRLWRRMYRTTLRGRRKMTLASSHLTCRFRSICNLSSSIIMTQADLNPLFNWNVKQLFLYLTAEYETPNNKLNQVVLWDKIILRGENAMLDYRSMNTKYYFWDDGNGLLAHKNVTMTLSWNIIPNAGNLPRITSHGMHSFSFPDSYTTSRVMHSFSFPDSYTTSR